MRLLIGETLFWKHNPIGNQEWQLFCKEKVIARISIPIRSPNASGDILGDEFLIEAVEPYKLRLKRCATNEPKDTYIIKRRNLNDEGERPTFKEWGRLGFGFGRDFNPTRLAVHDGGTYSISCKEISNSDYSREFVISSLNPGDDGQTIGITRQAKRRKDHCTFNIVQSQQGDPSIALMAAISFFMLIKVCLEENNFGLFDWSPFSGN